MLGVYITIGNTYINITKENAKVWLVLNMIVGLNALVTNVKPVKTKTKSKAVMSRQR